MKINLQLNIAQAAEAHRLRSHVNKPKHSWIQSPCTVLTPAGGTWKEKCTNT